MISPQILPDLPGFSDVFAKQSSWEWNFGQAPAFSHILDTRFRWGGVELHVDVEQGVINRCQIFTDSLEPAPFELLAEKLVGVVYQPKAVGQMVQQISEQYLSLGTELQQFHFWLINELK
ncbi:lipoyltransferase and lipoate-protein ligase family protein [Xenorhabdus szentirmaii]|nr:lipoyltransferase and lipoate-protein ligase family protein [Xenorhabdus szentirmaii]